MSEITCNSVAQNLSAFVDQELDDKTSESIKLHLCECLDCRRKFSKLIKTQYILRDYFNRSALQKFQTNFSKALSFARNQSDSAIPTK